MSMFSITKVKTHVSMPSTLNGQSLEMFTQETHEERLKSLFDKDVPKYLIGVTEMVKEDGDRLYSFYDGPSIRNFHEMNPSRPDPEKQREIQNIHYFSLDTFDLRRSLSGRVEKVPSESTSFQEMDEKMERTLPAISLALDEGNTYVRRSDRARALYVVADDYCRDSAKLSKRKSLPAIQEAMKWAWAAGKYGEERGTELCDTINSALSIAKKRKTLSKSDDIEVRELLKKALNGSDGMGVNDLFRTTGVLKRKIIRNLHEMERSGEIGSKMVSRGKTFFLKIKKTIKVTP